MQPHINVNAVAERYSDADPDSVSVVFAHAVADAVYLADDLQHTKPVVYAHSECDPVRNSEHVGHRNADADTIANFNVDFYAVVVIDAIAICHAHSVVDANSVPLDVIHRHSYF